MTKEYMQKYTYDQTLAASLEYFSGDDLAAKVFVDKYALQNKEGEYLELTPKDMHKRMASEFARIESKYPNPMSFDEIFDLMDNFKYVIPQGSPMFGIGNNHFIQSLGNCFVVENPFDSYGGICKTDQELAQLMKRRAGVGVDISHIRPRGLVANNAAKTTDGIGVFMERFSNTCREVAQNSRRGALMQSISIEHPEIETFITIKRNRTKVTGANVSVRITNEFMQAVKDGSDFTLRWPVNAKNPVITKTVSARAIWDKLIECAHESAEPGILFWDHIIDGSPADIYAKKDPNFRTQSTNPCGELPLGLDSCRLLVINLFSFVNNPFTSKASFDYDLFAAITQKAQRLMDDLIDLELEKINAIIEKIQSDPEPDHVKSVELSMWNTYLNSCRNGRRTGLGITGLGDCLAALNIKYGSKKSIEITESIYQQLAIHSYTSSCVMAKERGAFPIFEYNLEKDHGFLSRIFSACPDNTRKLWQKYGRRNIANLTTAPTGSVSTLTKTTSGIEPAYLLSYVRRKKVNPSDVNVKIDFTDHLGDKWQEFTIHHHNLKMWMDITGEIDISKSPYYEATSNDVDWMASVEIQAVAQKWIDHSISKTCNLPNSATKELVSDVYMKAWELGCKGFTVYRDGCRTGVLISKEESKDKDQRPNAIQQSFAPRRQNSLDCDIKKVKIQGEQWTIFIGLLEGKPYEIFGGLSKFVDIPNKYKSGKIVKNGKVNDITTYNLVVGTGDDEMTLKDIANIFENANYGSFTRSISLSLRHGVPVQFIVEQLQKDKYSDMTSFSKVIARVLKQYIVDGTSAASVEKKCPQCNGEKTLKYQDGCALCVSCGYSKC